MKIKVRDFAMLFFINCFLFQALLQTYISIFQFFDELIAVIMLVYLVLDCRGKIRKEQFEILVICFFLILLGTLGTIRYGYQQSWMAIFTDIINFFKYIIVFFGFLRFFEKRKKFNSVLLFQNSIIYILTIITCFFMLINFLVGIDWMTYEYRYGMRAFQFIYGHPGTLNVITTFCTMFIIYSLKNKKNVRRKIFYLLLNIIILMSTLRVRAWISALLIAILVYVFCFKKKKINLKLAFPVIVILVLLIAYDQFENYFISSARTPRSDLLKGGLELMIEAIPTGTGFATYGSFAASKYYSVLYYRFGFYKNFGMSKSDGQFLTDNFWPIVMAQYGIVGVIIYILLLYKLFKIAWRVADDNIKKCITILVFMIMLFNSTASSAFVHYTAVAYMFLLALFLVND